MRNVYLKRVHQKKHPAQGHMFCRGKLWKSNYSSLERFEKMCVPVLQKYTPLRQGTFMYEAYGPPVLSHKRLRSLLL